MSETPGFNSLEMNSNELSEQDRLNAERKLSFIAEFLKDATFHWQIDGGLNLPLYEGKIYRPHSDVDISINSNEIAEVKNYLKDRGYTVVVRGSFEENANLEALANGPGIIPQLWVVSEDKRSEIVFDLHIHKPLPDGSMQMKAWGEAFPAKYLSSVIKELPWEAGKKVMASQPAVIAYHKLYMLSSDRTDRLTNVGIDKDKDDLQRIAKHLSSDDLQYIESVINKEIPRYVSMVKDILDQLWAHIQNTDGNIDEFPLVSQGKNNAIIKALVSWTEDWLAKNGAESSNVLFRETCWRALFAKDTENIKAGLELLKKETRFH
jgi:hypothetical protein